MTFHVSVQYFQNTTFHVSVFCFQNTREGHTATLHKTEISCQCALAFEGHGSGGAQAGVHTGAEGARDFVHASACMPPQTHPRAACMLASASSPTRPRELRCAPCWERRERMTTCMMLNSACMLLQFRLCVLRSSGMHALPPMACFRKLIRGERETAMHASAPALQSALAQP